VVLLDRASLGVVFNKAGLVIDEKYLFWISRNSFR